MKRELFIILLLLTSLYIHAQPANDEPCNATFLGRLDENNRNIVATGLSNIGATNEVIFGDDSGLVLEIGGRFPSCKGVDSWRNTVWFYFDYEYPFNKIFSYEMRVNSGSLHTTLFLSQSICPLFGGSAPIVFAASDRGCNVPANDAEGFSLGCFDFSAWPNSRAGRIYIVVASDTDTEEGEFELEIFLPEPTFCNGCQDQNETAVDDTFEIDNLLKEDENAGSSNGSITVDGVTGGKQPLSYSIDGISFQNETTFQNLAAGTYTVTVQDASGCQTTQEITLDQLLPSPPEVNPPQVVCEGESQTVSAVGSNIIWYSDSGLSNQLGMGNEFTFSTSEYTILYATQTVNGFESEATSVNISFIDLPEVSIQVEGDECTAIFTAILNPPNDSATYQWLQDGVEVEGATNNTLNSIGSGSYQVRVMIDSCIILSEEESITGDIPAKPTVNEPPVYCEGDVVQPLMVESNGEIRWYADENLTQDLAAGSQFTPTNLTTTTTFYLQARLGDCTSEVENVTVQISPLPSAEITVQTTPCVGNTLEASSNLPNVSFQWFKDNVEIVGENNSTFTPQETGTYQVSASKDGCITRSESITILEIPQTPTVFSETTFCSDADDITLEASSDFEIFWYANEELTQLVNQGNTFNVQNIESQSFWLQAVNESCVSEVTPLELTIQPTPTISISSSGNQCVGESILTEVSSEAGSITWFLNGAQLENENGNQLTPQEAGIYSATVSLNGCSSTSNELRVDAFPTTPIIDPVPNYCEGDSIAPISASSTGTIRWYANETLTQEVGMGETFQPTGLNTTTTFWVQASNNNCLSNTASITVTISPVPSASISPQNTLCIGETLEAITDNPEGVTYQWTLNEQAIQGATEQVFIPQESGTYRVQISRSSCSTTSDSVRINDLPIANAGQDQTICLGDPIMLGNDTTNITNTFEWFGENGNLLSNESTFEIMPADTTFYVLRVTDANACFSVDTVNIQVDNTPIEAGFSVPYTAGYAPLEISFTDESVLADTVFWDFDDGNTSTERNPTYIFEKVGEYEVLQQVSVNEICFRDTTILIQVIEPLNIPNGISPNGDGSNDRWIIENIALFPEHTIRVFNQWGNLVFEASNYQNDWQGDNLPDATYFYVITLGSNVPDAKGYLVILR